MSISRRWRILATGTAIAACLIVLVCGATRSPTLAASGDALNGTFPTSSPDHFRVGTFNIHGGVGTDGVLNLDRIASAIRGCDLVGMQEVHGRTFGEPLDQAALLGGSSQRNWLFAPAERQWWHDAFGNGVLCRLPCVHWDRLPISGGAASNHRCLLRVDVRCGSIMLHVLVVHLPTTNDRVGEIAIVKSLFVGLEKPTLLLGDMNCMRGDPFIKEMRDEPGVVDGVGQFGESDSPQHVDWIFARGLRCVGGGVISNSGSDHPFYWNDFALPSAQSP